MIPLYDIDYSLRREREERAASLATKNRSARFTHDAMADRYADRAWAGREARCADADLKC